MKPEDWDTKYNEFAAARLEPRPCLSPQGWDRRGSEQASSSSKETKQVAASIAALGPRPQMSPQEWDAQRDQLRPEADRNLGPRPTQTPEAWTTQHSELLRRAIEAESNMEAILLALISEGRIDEGVSQEQRDRRLRASGLLRVAFRNLREQIEHNEMRATGFNDPMFWLMNRVQGELSRMVFARSVRKLQSRASSLEDSAEDYLSLIAYRTADLEQAAARLTSPVAGFIRARNEARDRTREANVQNILSEGSFHVTRSLDPVTAPGAATVIVILSNRKVFTRDLDAAADRHFATHPLLTHVLFIGDHLDTGQPPGSEQTEVHAVYVKAQTNSSICQSEDALPADLPYKPPPRGWFSWGRSNAPPIRRAAGTLLAWNQHDEMREGVRRIAEENI
jgi:hypothetical protein